MAILSVTTSMQDLRGTVFPEPVTGFVFSTVFGSQVYLSGSQFGGDQISNSLNVQTTLNPDIGFGTFYTFASFNIFLEGPTGASFDARGWNFGPHAAKSSYTQIYGTLSNDTIYGSSAQDTIVLDSGSDFADAGAGNDYINMNDDRGPDTIIGGSGVDYVQMSLQTETANLKIDLSDGGRGRDIGNGTTLKSIEYIAMNSGSGNDTLVGGAGNDSFDGGAGNDRIDGGSGGIDFLRGGNGDDVVISRSLQAGYLVSGGNGIDTLILQHGSQYLADVIDLSLNSQSPNYFTVSNDFEILNFTGGFAGDTIAAGALADRLDGGGGNDNMDGRSGRDTLIGGDGDDILTGGNGADKLTGGAGADTFMFAGKGTSLKGAQADLITDFEQGSDHIDISAVAGLVFVGTDALGANLAEVGYRQTATQTIITVTVDADDNGINEIDYEVRLNGLYTLTGDDFVL